MALGGRGAARTPRGGWLRTAYVVAIATLAAVLVPTVRPYLPPDAVRGYFIALHAPVPQKVYRALPPADRAKAYVFAQDYGQAAAVDVYDAGLGLPPTLSGHNQYGFWGPRDTTDRC